MSGTDKTSKTTVKTRRDLLQAATAAGSAAALLAGFGINPALAAEMGRSEKPLKAAFSNAGLQATWCAQGKQAAEWWGKLLNVEVTWFDGQLDAVKQRAAIARALAASPEVLLMDEPFAALDALTRGTLQHDLLALAEELQFTLVFVTHSIDEAILIGTRLHLLSAHPGRTITTFDTSGIGAAQLGSPQFRALSEEIRHTLFGRRSGAAA